MPKKKPTAPNQPMSDAQEQAELDTMPNPPMVSQVTPTAGYTDLSVVADDSEPKEGDVVVLPNGDKEVFTKGTWIVHVSPSPHTGQDNY